MLPSSIYILYALVIVGKYFKPVNIQSIQNKNTLSYKVKFKFSLPLTHFYHYIYGVFQSKRAFSEFCFIFLTGEACSRNTVVCVSGVRLVSVRCPSGVR